jgi:hypothetical protein
VTLLSSPLYFFRSDGLLGLMASVSWWGGRIDDVDCVVLLCVLSMDVSQVRGIYME